MQDAAPLRLVPHAIDPTFVDYDDECADISVTLRFRPSRGLGPVFDILVARTAIIDLIVGNPLAPSGCRREEYSKTGRKTKNPKFGRWYGRCSD